MWPRLGKLWEVHFRQILGCSNSINWFHWKDHFSYNHIDSLLISKWSEKGQRSRLQTIFSAKGPIYRRSVSIVTSTISSLRLSLTLNSVWYHINWPSKSTCIAMVNYKTKVYHTRDIVLYAKLRNFNAQL